MKKRLTKQNNHSLQILVENFNNLSDRLSILKNRRNLSKLDIFKRIRLRTGFFKIYESCDRLDFLEIENKNVKIENRNMKKSI